VQQKIGEVAPRDHFVVEAEGGEGFVTDWPSVLAAIVPRPE
jgi:hypothetical protein